MKKILTCVTIFAFGIAIGIAITYHPVSSVPPAIYKTEVYFSPNGGIGSHIIKAINDSKVSIDLAIFDITSQDIRSSLENAKKRGVKIRIIADSRQAKGAHSVIEHLMGEGFDVKIRHGEGRGIMHNKFAIIDSKLLITGSYNWTYSAERFNYENAIFIIDPNVIKEYQREFNKIW